MNIIIQIIYINCEDDNKVNREYNGSSIDYLNAIRTLLIIYDSQFFFIVNV